MLKSISRAIAFLALALVPLTSATAQEDDAKIVASVPPEVADIVTGGSWSADKQGGFYRAFVIMSGNQETFSAASPANDSDFVQAEASTAVASPSAIGSS